MKPGVPVPSPTAPAKVKVAAVHEANALTRVVSESELFAGVGSVWSPEADATFVSGSLVVTLTTITANADRPLGIVPTLHVSVPLTWLHAPLGSAITNVVPAGSVSVTMTFVAVSGPLLWIEIE